MLPPRLFPLVVVSFVFAADADAQMCESSLQSTGSTSVVLGVEKSVSAPTLGVRRFGDQLWGGAFVGRTAPELEGSTSGSDAFGNYIGAVRYEFLGGSGEMGWSTTIGPVWLCLSGSGTYSRMSGGEIDKFYTNALGQTIGFSREQFDPPSSSIWSARAELSGDYAIRDRAAVGVGFFAIHSSLKSPNTTPSESDEAGISLGLGDSPIKRLVLRVRYDHPLWASDDAPVRDGWFSAQVAWTFQGGG